MALLLVPDGLDDERIDVAAARTTGLSRSRIADPTPTRGRAAGRLLGGHPGIGMSACRGSAGGPTSASRCARPKVVPVLADGLRIVHEDSDGRRRQAGRGRCSPVAGLGPGPDVVSHPWPPPAGVQVSTSGG